MCGTEGLAHEAWDNPVPSWGPKALQKDLAGIRVGLACLVWYCCLTIGRELPALSLVLGRMASSCRTQGRGCYPYLSSVLTPSAMAPHIWEGLPLGGEPGTEWSARAGPAWAQAL